MRVVVFAALLFSFYHGVPAFAEETSAGLRVEPAEIDFGRALQHQVREAKVKLTNTGKNPVTFLPPATDCGCTTASLSKVTLLPGEVSLLTVKLETRAETGTVHRMVIVHASSGDLAVPVTIEIVPDSPP